MEHPFKFYLRKDASTYYTVSGSSVVESATAVPLRSSPDGWADIDLSFERNPSKHGIFTAYTNAYRFVRDGARILRSLLFSYGACAVCQIEIRKQNHTTGTYELYLVGDMDFATAIDEPKFFSVTVTESGLIAILKAHEKTIFEIPLVNADPELVRMRINSLLATGEASWVTTFPPTATAGNPIATGATYVDNRKYIFTAMTVMDSKTIVAVNNQLPAFFGNQAVSTDNSVVLRTFAPIYNVKFGGILVYRVNNASGSNETFKVQWNIGGSSPIIIFTGTAIAGQVTTFVVDVSIPASLTAGLPLDIAAGKAVTLSANITGGAWDYNWEPGRQIKVTFQNYTPRVEMKGLRYFHVLQRLISKMTAGQYGAASLLLSNPHASYILGFDNRPWDSVVTSGDGIRSVNNPVLKISLADLFSDADARWCVGMDTKDNVVRIEQRGTYYDTSIGAVDLGEAADFSIQIDPELIYTSLKVGYPEKTYDEVNGRSEFNTEQIYRLPIVAASKELDITSPWRSDMWGIFFIWTKYVLSQTKDSSSDNDIFVVEIAATPEPDGVYPALTLAQRTPTIGIIDPVNSFNFGFSPKRNLLRHGAYLHSLLYGAEDKDIIYQTTEKNGGLQSDFAAGLIKESANVAVAALQAKMFLPFIALAEIRTSDDLASMIQTNPYGEYMVRWNGLRFYGFILRGTVKGAHKDKYTFKLRPSTSNDLTALVR